MARFDLVIKRKALKELLCVPAAPRSKMIERIDRLGENPLPVGVKKLESAGDMYRIRQGDYRAIYTVDFNIRKVTVLTILHRSKGY